MYLCSYAGYHSRHYIIWSMCSSFEICWW
jgi:hypothetical protein